MIYLSRVLRLCFFPLLTVLVGVFVLLRVQQAREALVAIDTDHGHLPTQALAFELSFLAWMISAWYVTRLLLGRRFKPDVIGQCVSTDFARRLVIWLPRALALIAGVFVSLYVAL